MGKKKPDRRKGGPVIAGQVYIVGEKRPELFIGPPIRAGDYGGEEGLRQLAEELEQRIRKTAKGNHD